MIQCIIITGISEPDQRAGALRAGAAPAPHTGRSGAAGLVPHAGEPRRRRGLREQVKKHLRPKARRITPPLGRTTSRARGGRGLRPGDLCHGRAADAPAVLEAISTARVALPRLPFPSVPRRRGAPRAQPLSRGVSSLAAISTILEGANRGRRCSSVLEGADRGRRCSSVLEGADRGRRCSSVCSSLARGP
jgi:hypothetical protein